MSKLPQKAKQLKGFQRAGEARDVQDMLQEEELSSETVLKDSQKFKRGEKGHAGRGSHEHRDTDKCRPHQNPACHEPSLETRLMRRDLPHTLGSPKSGR